MILQAARHLLNLLNDVLDIARIEERQLSLSVEPVAAAEVITGALELVGPLAGRPG